MSCSICVPTGPRDAPVCQTCGRPLAVTPVLVPAAAPSRWEERLPAWVKQGLSHWRQSGYPRLLAFLRQARAERSGLLAAAVVVVVCWLVTRLSWVPLSKPPIWINNVVAVLTPKSCSGAFGSGLLYSLCAGTLGVMTMLGSFIALGLLFFFRRALSGWPQAKQRATGPKEGVGS